MTNLLASMCMRACMQAYDLLTKCLHIRSDLRVDAQHLRNHPFVTGGGTLMVTEEAIQVRAHTRFKCFNQQHSLCLRVVRHLAYAEITASRQQAPGGIAGALLAPQVFRSVTELLRRLLPQILTCCGLFAFNCLQKMDAKMESIDTKLDGMISVVLEVKVSGAESFN